MQIVCKFYNLHTMNEILTAVVLDTRRAKKDDTYPIKLRLTLKKKQKYYRTNYSFSEEEYAEITKPKPKKKYKEIQLKLQAIETRANEIIDEMPVFTFARFEKLYTNGKSKNNPSDAYMAINKYKEELMKQGRVSYAKTYENTCNSLKSYIKELDLADITPEFLRGYEKWMLDEGNEYSTIGIYLRNLRAVFNQAIADGHVSQDLYPFGKRKYQIPNSKNVKKALTLQDIEKLFTYQPETESEAKHRDLWVFSYLANGINIKDMLLLRYKDIEGDKIIFHRAKTSHASRSNAKPIVATMTPELEEIIRKWGNKDKSLNSYVFDYLTDGMSPEKELATKNQLIKQINKYVRRIAQKAGVEKDVTSYVARHSFATVLKRSGAPIEYISESLGHQNLRTTESYLDSFEDDVKKQYAKALTNFSPRKSER